MYMAFKSSITAEEIDGMSIASFNGIVTVIDSLGADYDSAIKYLSKQKTLGFDTETKPSFVANSKRNHVAILQLSGMDRAYIFRLNIIGLPIGLTSILSSNKIIKVGAAVNDDLNALQFHSKFQPKGFIDLQKIANRWGIEEKSVRKMAAIILKMRVSKSQQLSNWEIAELTDAQISYAAIDAWVCQKMYLTLLSTPVRTNEQTYSKEGQG